MGFWAHLVPPTPPDRYDVGETTLELTLMDGDTLQLPVRGYRDRRWAGRHYHSYTVSADEHARNLVNKAEPIRIAEGVYLSRSAIRSYRVFPSRPFVITYTGTSVEQE